MSAQFPLWTIPFLPLAGAIINGLLALGGAKTKHGPSRGVVALIAVLCPAISCVLTLLAASELSGEPHMHLSQVLWSWFATTDLHVDFNLLFDRLTSMMLVFVTGIGSLIHLYSVGYMWADRGFARFMCYMNLFMFSMIMLVIGGSLPVTFLGWEGVGLCSYLLIGFWYRTKEYNDAARKAFVMNRIGDLGFLIGAFALTQVCSSMDYRVITSWFENGDNTRALIGTQAQTWTSAAALLLFLGCTGKSAQIPLLTWLPDAMAGPTPVSALIHAATMVTSGVYLLARLAPVYAHADPYVLTVILAVGTLTALFGAVAGLFQNDIKKALAYSTVSQLGYMFMASGVGQHDVALFHVFTHAFFKATLFLGAGMLIHALHHEQDMRRMGGLHKLSVHGRKPLVLAHMMLCFAWWAILGLPLGSGFMSKDNIIESLFEAKAMAFGMNLAPVAGVIAVITAGITAIYMTRVMVLTFWSPSRVSEEVKAHLAPMPITMSVPVAILGIGSLMVGFLWWAPFARYFNLFPIYLAPLFHPALAEARLSSQSTLAEARLSSQPAAQVIGASPEVGNGWAITVAVLVVVVIGVVIAAQRWRKGPTGPTVQQHPSPDPVGFGAAWTWAFDRVYEVFVVLTKGLSLVLYWLVEQLIFGGFSHLVAECSSYLGDGYAATQRSRLRVSLALSMIGAALVLWIAPVAMSINWLLSRLSVLLNSFLH